MDFDVYALRKWRRYAVVRDRGVCQTCRTDFRTDLGKLNVHHIYPKSNPKYAHLAYSLRNAITLCEGCHRGVVHSNNTFLDIVRWENWRNFVPMFLRLTRLSDARKFAQRWDKKVISHLEPHEIPQKA